jgi:mycothiol synthase
MRPPFRQRLARILQEPAMPQPQLEMRRPHLDRIPEYPLPDDCGLRAYRPGDEVAWAEIMNECVGSGWTAEKCRKSLLEQPQFEAAGLFFAVCGTRPVGSACAWRKTAEERTVGYLHMVGVLRSHRGKRLGWAVSAEVLRYLRHRGFAEVRLLTDDWRLSAIRSYLGMGFEPHPSHESHPERWKKVHEQLAAHPLPEA